ncbi:hypothetical protein OJF2_51300 [Aquisphaera giovannonii]|uniref:Uncharacterized protein n=1 Tax=Aquisphaera giovannonii TaxID=406548 RepID=A0A5B9W795_9BACT|nr:hypothetical protein [Aquisphaera giovannonii]QEH36546.1 hypothetical protein OJF2_51300 [Aquisphaera giovannonii]
MKHLYWVVLAVLIGFLVGAYTYSRPYASRPWNVYPTQTPEEQDELLYLNRV